MTMFTQETIEAVTRVAKETGIEPAALLAVAEVETGGQAFAVVDGRNEPLIRFEGHYFDRRLSPDRRARARSLGLASPVAGVVANPASQAERWRLLRRAAEIDANAAWESTAWGLGQVMGAHWAWLGYASADALVAQARESAAGQARLMARYIVKAGLAEALAKRDWAAFARGYNGPAYRANRYDAKLASTFARHSGGAVPDAPASGSPLRRGDRGSAVADLQRALSAAGYPVAIDGRFGPETAGAVTRYQRDHGLAADGIAGPRTLASLREGLSLLSRLRIWWSRLIGFFRTNRAAAPH
jgi:murein L,D-transpeptidase YcbB/YkuD